jgi:hypothetical protein
MKYALQAKPAFLCYIRCNVYLVANELTEIDILHFSAYTIPIQPYRIPLSIIDNLDSSQLDHRTSQDKSTFHDCIELKFARCWQNALE